MMFGPEHKRSSAEMDAVLAAVKTAWLMHPEYRLCQLMSNAKGAGPQDLFYVEDEDIVDLLLASDVQGDATK